MPKILLSANTDWYLFNFRIALAELARSHGMEVVFVSPHGRFIDETQARGFRWIQWEVGRKTLSPLGEILSFFRLLRIYWAEKPQLVHHHTIKPVLYGTLAARLAGVRGIVNSITGMGYVFSSSDLTARLLRPFVKIFYRQVLHRRNVRVIFENNTDLELFIAEKLTGSDQVKLISGVGVDTTKFSPAPEPEEPILVLMASRMLWDKGVGIFVEAVRILHQRHTFRAVLAGEPDPGNPSNIPHQVIRDWQNEGLVEWWGWQPDMPKTYSQSHIVAFPTMYGEGIPTVLLEALSCGRAVVATDVPGCRDVVTHGVNGLLVPLKDAEALAEALEILITDGELRRKMGTAGRTIALEQFGSLKVNLETLAVYRQLID